MDVYKCHVERSDCTLCLIAPTEWKCGWCNSTLVSGKCGISNFCDSFWSNDKCKGPEINSVRIFVPYSCSNSSTSSNLPYFTYQFNLNTKDTEIFRECCSKLTWKHQCDFIGAFIVNFKNVSRNMFLSFFIDFVWYDTCRKTKL